MQDEHLVILHDIRSAYNVGAIFRTADGAGISKIYLCGYTPAPVDRFGRAQPEITKTSLGATETVSWEKCEDTETLLRKLKHDGFTTVSVEQSSNSIPYNAYTPHRKIAYIFGNEREGVPDSVLNMSDVVVAIPMHGKKESLNVSVAVGIIVYHYLQK